jgi:hypothetical protein
VQLDRVALVLRPRTAWEAMDLGFAMARQWWRPVWGAWCAVYLPVAFLLHALFAERPLIAALVLWWLKPAFDRVVLHVLGGAVFGAAPSVGATLRTLKQALTPGLVWSLTLYRFDLARSFNLPVWQLERARGAAARRRARTLHRKARGHAVWLTLICLHFELVVVLSLTLLVEMLTPRALPAELGWSVLFASDLPQWRQWSQNLFYLAAVTLIEPCYVAAGFALYLNRRTHLEAWDIELALQHLSQPPAPRLAALVAALGLTLMLAGPAPSTAADRPQPGSARAEIAEVLKDPVFDRHRNVGAWRYTGRGLGWEPGEQKREPEFKWENFARLVAEIARAVLWIGGALLLAWLLRAGIRYARAWTAARKPDYTPPEALFGLDIRPQSLPADIAAAALELCAQQRLREALGLLYRGALSQLVHQHRVEVRAGDTEEDCLRRVAARGESSTTGYFAALVGAWQQAAYAGRAPAQPAAESLCRDWERAFGREGAS